MNEIDRLLDIGFINDAFLSAEERCGFSISHAIKKVWAVQLYLLREFIDVCKEHNLVYWAYGGTLLGAVRHKGYIPWDDDIDVAMPREDYDLLCAHPEWFKRPAALHIPSNSERYYEGWLRLHDVCTAVLYENYKKEGSVQGIYIDIFPIDNYRDTFSEKRKIKRIWRTNIIGHAYVYNANKHFIARLLSRVSRTLHCFNCERAFKKINNLAKSKEQSKEVMMKVGHFYSTEKQIFNKDDYGGFEEMPFEFLTINVPSGWDNILRKNYGDYLKYPPVEKRGCWHSFIFEVDAPFSSFIKN